jgi:hypothetical protein
MCFPHERFPAILQFRRIGNKFDIKAQVSKGAEKASLYVAAYQW